MRGEAPRSQNPPSSAVWLRQTAEEGGSQSIRQACGRPNAISVERLAQTERITGYLDPILDNILKTANLLKRLKTADKWPCYSQAHLLHLQLY
jgi:hypothetical protein